MRGKLKREVLRKTLHLSGVSVPLAYAVFGRDWALLFTAGALLFIILVEFMRIRASSILPLLRNTNRIARQYEISTIAASMYYCIASVIAIYLFGGSAVVIGLTAAIVSDAVAAVVGVAIGRHHIMSTPKTVEGTAAGTATSLAIASLLGAGVLTNAAVGIVFIAMDVFDLGIDDNFTTPLAMAAAVQLIGAFP